MKKEAEKHQLNLKSKTKIVSILIQTLSVAKVMNAASAATVFDSGKNEHKYFDCVRFFSLSAEYLWSYARTMNK